MLVENAEQQYLETVFQVVDSLSAGAEFWYMQAKEGTNEEHLLAGLMHRLNEARELIPSIQQEVSNRLDEEWAQ